MAGPVVANRPRGAQGCRGGYPRPDRCFRRRRAALRAFIALAAIV